MNAEQIKKNATRRVAEQMALPRFYCVEHREHVASYCEGMCEDHECEPIKKDEL